MVIIELVEGRLLCDLHTTGGWLALGGFGLKLQPYFCNILTTHVFFRSQQPLFKAKQVLRRRCQQQLYCCSMLQPVQLSLLLLLQSFARVFAGLDKRAGDRSRN